MTKKLLLLRCTLMGVERHYQVNILSNQLNKSFFSTTSTSVDKGSNVGSEGNAALNPHFVTGFIDAEGCFSATIYKNINLKTGYRVRAFFEVKLNIRDSLIIYQLKEFFGGIGTICIDKKANAIKYSVDSLKDLTTVIIPFFLKYPLITQKGADFKLFVLIVNLINKGAHLTLEGLQQIINIKASMNFGVSDSIKSEFSNINPVEREIIETTNIPDPNWISGFVSGEGNFDAGIRKSTNKIGFRTYLRFRIPQHARDVNLIKLIILYLGAGRLEQDGRKPLVYLVIGNFTDLTQIIIPFFNKYPILGVKKLDYQDWCKIASLISTGANLTPEGFEEIRQLEAGMNRARKR